MSDLVKKSFRILLGRGVVSALSLLFTMFFAYELPKSIFALIALYDTAVSLSKVFTDLGLHFKVIREATILYYSEERTKAIKTIIQPCSLMRLIVSAFVALVFGGLLFIFKDGLQESFPDLNIAYIIVIASCHLFLENIQVILTPVYAVVQRFGTNSFLESLTLLLESVFAVALYLYFGINQYFLGILCGQLITFGLRYYFVREIFSNWSKVRLSRSYMFSVLKEYFPFYLRKFFRVGINNGEHLIIVALLPLEQLANFKLAKKGSSFLKQYISAFTDPLIIRLAKSRDLAHRRKYAGTFLWFTIPVPIILALLSPWIMPLLGGKKYADSWFILGVLYFSYVFHSLAALQLSVISVFGKPTEFLLRDAIGGVIGLIATLVFVLLMQENGIAWGQLVSAAVLYIAGYRIAQKYIYAASPVLPAVQEPPADT
jgi:O-antigen/teichoic acid export membrane protein